MRKPPPEFSARRAAGESLASLSRHYKAAQETVKAWDLRDDIQTEIQYIRQQATDDAIGQLHNAAGEAITTVLAVMRGSAACGACGRPATADRDKLKAGEMILARVAGLESGERREVTARIASDPGADARLILQEAALILEERGLLDLAVAVRAESRR